MAAPSRTATRRVLTVLALAGATGIVPLAGTAFAAPTTPAPGATQGGSGSNPDGAGVDKPFAADGQPAESQGTSDFDGNNGCGNDDDRADDNNGNCGGPKKDKDKAVTAEAAPVVILAPAPVVVASTPDSSTAPRNAVTTVVDGVVYDGTAVTAPVALIAPAAAPVAVAAATAPQPVLASAPVAQTAPAAKAPVVKRAQTAERSRRIQPAAVRGVRIARTSPQPAAVLGVRLSRTLAAPAPVQVLGAAQVAGATLPRTGNGVPLQLAFMVGGLMVVAGGTSLSLGRARQ